MEVFEADTALGTFAHFHNVLLDMLERVDFTWSERPLNGAVANLATSDVHLHTLPDVDGKDLQNICLTEDLLTPAEDLDRSSRWCFRDLDSSFVAKSTNSGPRLASNDNVTKTQSSSLDQYRGSLSSLLDTRFKNPALSHAVFHALTSLSTDGNNLHITSKIFNLDTMASKIGLDLVDASIFLVNLVDCNNDRNFSSCGVFQRLDGLRHNTIVSSNNQHHNVCDVGASLTHGQECSVAWCIEECDLLA
ncbi:hypothetical protein HG530_015579 [Fusarium avenaceum]|nr:hypothetical protein HG530_015579 [Fusarium avenaceum]